MRLRLRLKPASRTMASESACSELLMAAIRCAIGRSGCAAISKPSADVTTARVISVLAATSSASCRRVASRISAANRWLEVCMVGLGHLRLQNAKKSLDQQQDVLALPHVDVVYRRHDAARSEHSRVFIELPTVIASRPAYADYQRLTGIEPMKGF